MSSPETVSALSKFLFVNRAGKPHPRTHVAIFCFLLPCSLGALALAFLGANVNGPLLNVIAVATLVGGIVGGFLLHPVPRFRWRGVLAGAIGAPLVLLASYVYVSWRFTLTGNVLMLEVLVPILLGLAPAWGVYHALMRHQRVPAAEAAKYAER